MKKKYQQLAKSMNTAFSGSGAAEGGGGSGLIGSGDSILGDSTNEGNSLIQTYATEEEKLSSVEDQVEDLIEELGLKDSVSTYTEDKGLVISFNDNIFFESGKADIMEDMKSKLVSLSTILNKIDNYVRVEGHTDNIPIHSQSFHSNWQLSSVRASNVVQFLSEEGNISPERLSAIGYGEYRPVSENTTEKGRASNRRVDILILNNKYDSVETKQK